MISKVVRILEADPALADGLDAQARALATDHVWARVETIAPGQWHSRLANEACDHDLGILLLEGVMSRRVQLDDSAFLELIGAGDLFNPWRVSTEQVSIQFRDNLAVLTKTSIVLLDRRFTLAISRWPEITANLMDRALTRARSIAFQAAISHLTRVEVRLMATLWYFADRWGHVTPRGVTIPLRLTNEMLASIVGARRPSVSTAINVLVRRRMLYRCDDGSWLLVGDPPSELGDLRLACGLTPQRSLYKDELTPEPT